MKNLLSLKEILEGTKKSNSYYIQTYDSNFDIVDIIRKSCMLVQKYGGHLYLGSDPGNLGNPFGLIPDMNIYFSNGFVLHFDGHHRLFENGISHFESILYFRKRKQTTNNTQNITTRYFEKRPFAYFELSNVDYEVGKEEEEFYWYNVNSEIAKAPCSFHALTLDTLESYAEYVASLNAEDFKLSRIPGNTWGTLTDRKKRIFSFALLNSNRKSKSIESMQASDNNIEKQGSSLDIDSKTHTNLCLESKIRTESDIFFNLDKKTLTV